jgi:predicted nucleotidyltransferase
MKYESEFRATKNKQEFIAVVSKQYPNVKISTIDRAWYKCRTKINLAIISNNITPTTISTNIINNTSTHIEIDYLKPKEEERVPIKPTQAKMILLEDMIKFKKKITRDYLLKFGFDYYELEWLEVNNILAKN